MIPDLPREPWRNRAFFAFLLARFLGMFAIQITAAVPGSLCSSGIAGFWNWLFPTLRKVETREEAGEPA